MPTPAVHRPRAHRIVRAPGRVNVIGDHTDYQAGLCLPIAIDKEVRISFDPRTDGRVRVRSAAFADPVDLPADGSARAEGLEPAWGRTVAAVLTVLARQGRDPVGFDAEITTTVPMGSGLSSSAALGVAVTLAAAAVSELPTEPAEVALAAQAAEHLASGVPCGVMDQVASVSGRAGHALLLDCRTLEITPVPIPTGVEIVVIHSGLERRLEASAYADRRAACETAAARLGVEMLRDATIEQVADDPIARHVVTENARVAAFVTALRDRDLAACALMLASHRSLRDDFAVSTPELDLLVNLAVDAGAYGARLTGAGFGGCVVALVRSAIADSVAEAVCARYRSETGREPNAFTVSAVDGAGFVTTS